MSLPRRSCTALALSLLVGLGAYAPTTAGAETPAATSAARAEGSKNPASKTPSSEPLPGYTVSNPAVAPLTIRGKKTRVLQGVRRHAAYIVEIPRQWNGELVMWEHGFRGAGTELSVDQPRYDLRQLWLDQGYAWAASSYARNDYDVGSGVTTTRDLARFAGRQTRSKPSRVYLAGISMGGHIIARSLEEYPGAYDGALPMCGVLGDQELFDYFLSYNLVAQDLADRPVYPAPANYLSNDVPAIEQQLGLVGLTPGGADTTNAKGKQLRDITTELTGGPRPGSEAAFAYWKDFPFTLFTPDTGGSLAQNAGRLAQNLRTVYSPNTPVDVNAGVRRLAPRDTFSRNTRRLTQVPTIKGDPRVPVLTLHGLGDLFVPFSMEQIYSREVARRQQSALLVQRAIRSVGHCEYTDDEVGAAWNDLTSWVEKTTPRHPRRGRPAGDRIDRPRAVRSATFGCRFTDPAGAASSLTPTHALYPPCPA